MWFARVPALAGCHTQGRTIAQARTRIREAISLFDDHAAKATLVDDVRLPKAVSADLEKLRELRAAHEAIALKMKAANAKLARALTAKAGVSLADAGELLGVSKQRVQQILEEAG
jgi:predicted RNase H-like HicB family nuclease